MPKSTLVAACIIAAPALWGQAAARTFDVAAIKAHPSSSLPDRYIRRTELGLSACTTVFGLIRVAYDLQQYQIAGGPSWINSQYWDIAAKTETAIPTEDWPALVVQLLTDRFQLKVRRETRTVAGYALIVNPGPVKLKKSAPDANYSFRIGRGRWTITRVDMSRFAQDLTQEVGATVVDATGLAGFYDVALEWAVDSPVASNNEDHPVTMRSTLFDAIKEQLGLRLESRKLPLEMLIVERLERPSEN